MTKLTHLNTSPRKAVTDEGQVISAFSDLLLNFTSSRASAEPGPPELGGGWTKKIKLTGMQCFIRPSTAGLSL